VLLKLDIKNAFNSILRDACLDSLTDIAPSLASYAEWMLRTPTPVIWHQRVFQCDCGVQQGSPLAPMLFALGIHPILQEAFENTPSTIDTIWYLDDGILSGPIQQVTQVAVDLEARLKRIGLTLNWRKCELYSPTQKPLLGPLSSVQQLTDMSKWTYLGAPITDGPSVCYETTTAKSQLVCQRIGVLAMKHPQYALQLLKMCTGACRAEYVLKSTTNYDEATKLTQHCANAMKEALAKILGTPAVAEDTWIHATLPVKMGGIGIRDPQDIWPACALANLTTTGATAASLVLTPTSSTRCKPH